uniref:Kinesin-like protein n=1 Tax=Hyaloperonospora arabidopsidis (strain Emoy2) TaxID=559515 RepID=M4BUK2_HYAAE
MADTNDKRLDSSLSSIAAPETGSVVRKISFNDVVMDELEREALQDEDEEGGAEGPKGDNREDPKEDENDPKEGPKVAIKRAQTFKDNNKDQVQIVIRLRPLDSVHTDTESECFRVLSDVQLLVQPPKTSQSYRSTGTATSFHFSRIFQSETQQTELFEATTRPVLEAAFQGKSGLVFAYGVTNSGKTYTISGTAEAPGVLPQALEFVMEQLSNRIEFDVQLATKVTVTYLEIYNENVYDLLSPARQKRRALRVQDCDGKIQVRGAVEKMIKTLDEGMELLEMGRRHKQMAETNCNSDSSRSHCVFTLHFYHHGSRASSDLFSKVSIVDLAGSERGSKSGASGRRMQEASKINGSLMNLMRCLETLRWNKQHPPSLQKMVPFRESKLARLFQENLVGNDHGPLVMIVAVNPSCHEFDETLRTLKYSAVARELVRTRTSIPRKAAPTATFYDLDGRLKKRRRQSAEKVTHQVLDSIAGENVIEATAGVTLSPAEARVEPRNSDSRRRQIGSVGHGAAMPTTVDVGTSPIKSRKEVLKGELYWADLEMENEEFRGQLAQIRAGEMQMEVRIRAEVVEEMREQLQQIRAQYQSTQIQQRENLPSARKRRERQHAEECEKLRAHVQELREKVRECEDEIQRLHKRHQAELDKLEPNFVVIPVEDEKL